MRKEKEAPKPQESNQGHHNDRLPGYMRPTATSSYRESLLRADRERKSIAPGSSRKPSEMYRVEPPAMKDCPRYMRPTEAFQSRISIAPSTKPVRSSQIRPVDTENLPRYMRPTTSYRQSIAPEPVKKPITSSQIRELNPDAVPHYMRSTEASERWVEPEFTRMPVSSTRIKEVKGDVKPRYMRETASFRKLVEPARAPSPVRKVPSGKIKEVDPSNLPRYMQHTQATSQHLVGVTAHRAVQTTTTTTPSVTPSVTSSAVETSKPTVSATSQKASFMRGTRCSVAHMEAYEKQQEERKRREAEILRQRNSLMVRRERWDRNVKMAESVAIRHKERWRQEVEQDRRALGDCGTNV